MPIISPKIPSGLEELMRGLAKSCIKENPDNIYEFAAEYFENLLKERDGTVDQSYKKFATYKVYKKNKSARLKRGKESSNDVNDVCSDSSVKKDKNVVNYVNQNSFGRKGSSSVEEEFILPQSSLSLSKAQTSISSESEIKASILKEPSLDDEGAPSPSGSRGNSEDDDIKNMVLDDEMAQAALKIQSTFRGHKVRRDMKEPKSGIEDVESEPSEPDAEIQQELAENNDVAEMVSDDMKVDDEIADMVLDDEMEQAALKIQSTFRGHKTRKEIKKGEADNDAQITEDTQSEAPTDDEPQEENFESSAQEVDDEIAGMVLDDEMEQAALKIQSTFRGHKVRRDVKETLIPKNADATDDEERQEGEAAESDVQKSDEGEDVVESEVNLSDGEVLGAEDMEKLSGDESDVKEALETVEVAVDDAVAQEILSETEAAEEIASERSGKNSVDDIAQENEIIEVSEDVVLEIATETLDKDEVTQEIETDAVVKEDEETIALNIPNEASEIAFNEVVIETAGNEAVENEIAQKNSNETSDKDEPEATETAIEIEIESQLVEGETVADADETLCAPLVESPLEGVKELSVDGGALDEEEKVVDKGEAEAVDETEEIIEALNKSASLESSAVEVNETEDNPTEVEMPAESLTSFEAEEVEKVAQELEETLDEVAFEEQPTIDNENANEIETTNPEGEQEIMSVDEATNEIVEIENLDAEENELKPDEIAMPEGVEGDVTQEKSVVDGVEINAAEAEQIVIEENTEQELIEPQPSTDETLENPIESEDVIELIDRATSLADNENEKCDDKPQADELIENNVGVNEQEPQEGLSDLPNESENEHVEADDAALGSPVVEDVCVKKSVEKLESDQERAESEIDETICKGGSLDDQAEADAKRSFEKLPSDEIAYATLKESLSEHDVTPADSVDEVDNKSRDITDEKSIDGDTNGSKQHSLDENEKLNELHDETMNEGDAKLNESFIHSSTVDNDVEVNDHQSREKFEEQLVDTAEIAAVETLLQKEISPIELMDEVVNEYAGAVANEMFGEREPDLIKSFVDEDNDGKGSSVVEPKLSGENPLEAPPSIDLSKESVQVSQDEIEPIRDEILQPEYEESEIPEETQAPMDENVPTIALEENAPTLGDENDLPQQAEEANAEPKPPQVEDDVADMILDDEMEEAALKIQAAFRGHQVRKENVLEKEDETEEQQNGDVTSTVVVDQCSEENQETPEQDEGEQQDTSADVEEIQESETAEQEETQEEPHEEEDAIEEETAVESAENETTEHAEDDPDGTPEEAESAEQPQNDDDDVANMVLDDEMEQAALKIQSTFRGHKTRKDMKNDAECEAQTSEESKEQKDPVDDVDDEIANMVLDDEMEQAALKIQSTFRGHKTRKDMKKEDEDNETKEEEDEKKDEEPAKEEEKPESSSTEKSAKQMQEEEDIAGLVMDAEMEQTALKIQSAFRGKKIKKPAAKDGDESDTSSAGDQDDEDESQAKSDEDPFNQNEAIVPEIESGAERSYDDEKGSDYSAHYSQSDERYSVERYVSSCEYEPLAANTSTDDINLMQGGGIFPEPSGESSDMLTGSSGEDKDPERNSSYEKILSADVGETDEVDDEAVAPLIDENVIESFDFIANKDTAEAMYYSLKKNEIETQRQLSMEKQLSVERQQTEEEEEPQLLSTETSFNLENQSSEHDDGDEDDDDVVVGIRQAPPSAKRLKFGMSMDDRLLGSILSQDYSAKANRRDGYPDDGFDPLLEATMRNHHFLEKLHEMSNSDEDKMMPYDEFADGVGDEDQFDDFYNSNNIRQKMMASSISIADSDYFDPTNNKSMIDDDTIRTALETIHSTDSESTIASAATKIQVGERMNSRRNNNMQYSSIGNAAIDKSLDEFIQSQELRIDRFDEEMEGYNSPPPRMAESLEEWTDDTTTYTDSDKKVASGGVVGIKLEQKQSFLTVDERRRTLHREDAIQRNSTREDEDSSKSSNASGEKLLDKNSSPAVAVVAPIVPQDSIIDTEIAVPVLDLTAKSKSSSLSLGKPQRMKRQHTMPVQIQTDVLRVIPKHLRKRIKSADGDKKKRVSK